MKFKNPYALPAGVAGKVAQHAPAVEAWLRAQVNNKVVTLAELRAGLPSIGADLSRPVVNQILQDLGIEIENPEDDAA